MPAEAQTGSNLAGGPPFPRSVVMSARLPEVPILGHGGLVRGEKSECAPTGRPSREVGPSCARRGDREGHDCAERGI